ncbi:hypothetical protein Tco_1167309 [Tanacetum coccineum]
MVSHPLCSFPRVLVGYRDRILSIVKRHANHIRFHWAHDKEGTRADVSAPDWSANDWSASEETRMLPADQSHTPLIMLGHLLNVNGVLSIWEQFTSQVEAISSVKPFMIARDVDVLKLVTRVDQLKGLGRKDEKEEAATEVFDTMIRNTSPKVGEDTEYLKRYSSRYGR